MLQSLVSPSVIPQAREHALKEAPGRPVIMLRPAPVKVRSILGLAIAYTVTHVLVEWNSDEQYNVRWEAAWLVHRVEQLPEVPAAGAGHH
jgi:hypothetical protein